MKQVRERIWKSVVLIGLCAALTACGSANQAADTVPGGGSPSGIQERTDSNKTVVTMAVMTKDRFLEEAEQKFESAHPDMDIRIEETAPSDSGGGNMVINGRPSGPSAEQVEKYINAVNTAIMSGKAADIVSVEYLPFDKYVEKGLLADRNELAEGDEHFQKSNYYENIFHGVSDGDFWYGIPTSFSLSVMVGDAALLEQNGLDDRTWTWDQFVALLEKLRQSGDGNQKVMVKRPNGQSYQLTDEDIEHILSVIPSVGKYENRDAKVLDMIREESKAYFTGNKTGKAVIDALANRITAYLNE